MNEETSWKLKIDLLRDKFLLVFTEVPLATFTFHLNINKAAEYGYSFRTSHPRISHSPVATQQFERRTWG